MPRGHTNRSNNRCKLRVCLHCKCQRRSTAFSYWDVASVYQHRTCKACMQALGKPMPNLFETVDEVPGELPFEEVNRIEALNSNLMEHFGIEPQQVIATSTPASTGSFTYTMQYQTNFVPDSELVPATEERLNEAEYEPAREFEHGFRGLPCACPQCLTPRREGESE